MSAQATRNAFPAKTALIVIGVLTCLIAGTAALSSCQKEPARYDWENLTLEDGYPAYYADGVKTSAIGVDVSDLQGSIDWNAVKLDGVDFAMIRCGRRGYTEGSLYEDKRFEANVTGATAAGMPFGVYFFSQATTEDEAREEANYVLDKITGIGVDYPIAFDHEPVQDAAGRANNLSPQELTEIADAFCARIQAAGYQTMVYGNQYDLARFDLTRLESEIWYAEYTQGHPTSDSQDFVMWQYTNQGSVNGIGTAVDLNILFENSWVNKER